MNRPDIFNRLEAICHQIFGAAAVITEETASADVETWDSMNHVMLIAAIEKEFAVKFDIMEIIELTTIRDFVDLVEKKTN